MQRLNQSASVFELDLGRYELRRHGHRIKLERKPMDLLIFLLSRRDQLVSRKEIVAKLWRSDLFIDTEPNINNIIRKIRAALGDDPSHPRFLETVVGKGYRFVGPVRVIDARFPSSDFAASGLRATAADHAAGWSERSSLAVLPLLLLGKSADDHGICLGFADALITRLGNLPGVDVLPISAVMNFPASAPPSETATRLGSALSSMAGCKCPKANGGSPSNCWTRTRNANCFPGNMISTPIASPISKTTSPGKSPSL